MSAFIRAASFLRCPWQRTGVAPPLVSMMTSENMQVGVDADRGHVRHVDRLLAPSHDSGVKCTTLVGVMSTCVGKQPVPARQPAGTKDVPLANGRPFEPEIANTKRAITPAPTATRNPEGRSRANATLAGQGSLGEPYRTVFYAASSPRFPSESPRNRSSPASPSAITARAAAPTSAG